jgi:hypothetical protein
MGLNSSRVADPRNSIMEQLHRGSEIPKSVWYSSTIITMTYRAHMSSQEKRKNLLPNAQRRGLPGARGASPGRVRERGITPAAGWARLASGKMGREGSRSVSPVAEQAGWAGLAVAAGWVRLAGGRAGTAARESGKGGASRGRGRPRE